MIAKIKSLSMLKLLLIIAMPAVFGTAGTLWGLKTAFETVTFAEPSDKASILAEGISSSMGYTFWGWGLTALFGIALVLITKRWGLILWPLGIYFALGLIGIIVAIVIPKVTG